MRILVLGGTSFVGRAVVEHALDEGHELTLFSRGRTGADLFPGVARCTGDRDTGDYASLADGSWDAVVDVTGYVPRHVQQAADAVGDRVGRYLFVSTVSVYDRDRLAERDDEDAARSAPEHGTERVDGSTYGPLKVACEDVLVDRFGERLTVVRPGVVAGPHDTTDRFTWWVRRAAAGGPLPMAGRPEQPVQVVDARDLAVLVARLLADDRPGTFDAVGPAEPVTLEGLAAACGQAAGVAVDVVPVEADLQQPLVLPDPSADALFRRSGRRAREAGMPATALPATAAAVRAWDVERGEPPLTAGPSPERERQLLEG